MNYCLRQDESTWIQRLITSVLVQGKMPIHVAFILDGNRTYAKKMAIEIRDGHRVGVERSAAVLNWCRMFGVKEITGYVFSIENYSRPLDELYNLHILLKNYATNQLNNLHTLRKQGIRVRIIGDWELMHKSIVHLLAKLMYETKDNKGLTLNFAFAYTSRNEMLRAAMNIETGLQDSTLHVDDITPKMFDKIMRLKSSTRPVDLLIRTSGVTRLSDFMLWQSSSAVIYFTDVLWPELTFWDILKAFYFYRRQVKAITEINDAPELNIIGQEKTKIKGDDRVEKFLVNNESEYWTYIKSLSGNV